MTLEEFAKVEQLYREGMLSKMKFKKVLRGMKKAGYKDLTLQPLVEKFVDPNEEGWD